MKKSLILLSLALGLASFPARAEFEVSAGVSIHAVADFDAPLATGGSWVTVGSYGRCWRPAGVAVDWQPYCDGSWVWTDNGWYWQTDEPFGWACYHYGSWTYDPAHYWVWIPGTEWAPAWVSWRHGGGYVGWAPLGPNHVVVEGPRFVFVHEDHFSEPVRRSAVVVNNTTIINKTTVINNVHVENRNSRKVVVNEGPGLATMQKATRNQVKTVAIATAVERTKVPSSVQRTTVKTQTTEKSTVTREPARTPTPAPTRQESRRPAPAPERNVVARPETREPVSPRVNTPAHVDPKVTATEPAPEHHVVPRVEQKEDLTPRSRTTVATPPVEKETRPSVLEKSGPRESKERAVKPVTHPAVREPHPVAPRAPVEQHEEKRPEKP